MNSSKLYLFLMLLFGLSNWSFSNNPDSETLVIPITTSSQITQSEDDAQESLLTGQMEFINSELYLGTKNDEPYLLGLRFNNIEVPEYALITNAYIQFTAVSTQTDAAHLEIRAEAINHAAPFSSNGCHISDRPTTAGTVKWEPAPWVEGYAGPEQQTPNLASLLQEIVSQQDWFPQNSMVLMIEGSGIRTAAASDGCINVNCAPTLVIEYESTCLIPPFSIERVCIPDSSELYYLDIVADPVTTTVNPFSGPFNLLTTVDTMTYVKVLGNTKRAGPFESGDTTNLYFYSTAQPACNFYVNDITHDCTIQSTSSEIRSSTDDAEEILSSGSVNLVSPHLNIAEILTEPQMVGLRFENLKIPQGAEIVDARIQFKSAGVNLSPGELIIRAHDNNNSKTFDDSDFNISDRKCTDTMATWIPKVWAMPGEEGSCQETSDFSVVVQEVVDRIPWTEESAISILIEGQGERTAASFDGCIGCGAEMFVDYIVHCPRPDAIITLVCDATNDQQYYVKLALLSGRDSAYIMQHNLDPLLADTVAVGDNRYFGPFPNNVVMDLTLTSVVDSNCIFYYLDMTKNCGCLDLELKEERYIATTPFINSNTSLLDGEGMAFVPVDKSLWVCDDNGRQLAEMDYLSGELKQIVPSLSLQFTPQLGGSNLAGEIRVRDLEAMAYDAKLEHLYVFSGACCQGEGTAFRLLRNPQGIFEPADFQPLVSPNNDFSGVTFHPTLGLLLGENKIIYQYDYLTNTFLNTWSLQGTGFTGDILGMGIAEDGEVLWVVSDNNILYKYNWQYMTAVQSFDLDPVDILDGRAMELIFGQAYILDGEVNPPDPDKQFAVTVFDFNCASGNLTGDDDEEQDDVENEVTDFSFNNFSPGQLNNTSTQIELFPNPVSEELKVMINNSESTTAQIKIFDAFGRKVSETGVFNLDRSTPFTTNFGDEKNIKVGQLPAGIYSVSVQFGNGELTSKFFVKQ